MWAFLKSNILQLSFDVTNSTSTITSGIITRTNSSDAGLGKIQQKKAREKLFKVDNIQGDFKFCGCVFLFIV